MSSTIWQVLTATSKIILRSYYRNEQTDNEINHRAYRQATAGVSTGGQEKAERPRGFAALRPIAGRYQDDTATGRQPSPARLPDRHHRKTRERPRDHVGMTAQ